MTRTAKLVLFAAIALLGASLATTLCVTIYNRHLAHTAAYPDPDWFRAHAYIACEKGTVPGVPAPSFHRSVVASRDLCAAAYERELRRVLNEDNAKWPPSAG